MCRDPAYFLADDLDPSHEAVEFCGVRAHRDLGEDLALLVERRGGVGPRIRPEQILTVNGGKRTLHKRTRPGQTSAVPKTPSNVLRAVLFTDVVGSTELARELGDQRWARLLEAQRRVVREELRANRGREIDTAGDGFFAIFEGPADAVRCAFVAAL